MVAYNKSKDEILEEVNSSQKGLSSFDAQNRLKKNGKNLLVGKKKISEFVKFLLQFKDVLILVLLAVFFYFMATNSVETFMSLYSGQVLNDTNAGLFLFGVLALGSFVFLYPSAVFADKYGFRNAMLLGACLMAGANVFIAFFTCYSHLLIPAFFISTALYS